MQLNFPTMAFFGLTNLGYQNPIGDKMIVNPRKKSPTQDGGINIRAGLLPSLDVQQGPLRCTNMCDVNHQPVPNITDIHHGSHERYKDMVRKGQTPRSPNQLYNMPVTENQQYGWMLSKSPEPWTQIKRFPRKNSEMSRVFKEM